jgi:hypothetical protein
VALDFSSDCLTDHTNDKKVVGVFDTFIFHFTNKFEYFCALFLKRAERNHYNHRRTWYWQSTLIDGLTAKGFVVILKSLSNFGSEETRNRAIIS